ncbi:MAG: MotA/TolQ/ExbB proton channel family protein [Chitinophagaceae bacterium]|nr:MAG: MotA/TolQ/ExbB proton channel family protein [Chitinophagaceae bacterium]
MKKTIFFNLVLMMSIFIAPMNLFAEQDAADEDLMNEEIEMIEEETEQAQEVVEEEVPELADLATPGADEEEQLRGHQIIKRYFIEGGPEFMGIVLICLILGLAFSLERIITINLASTNTKKLLEQVENELKNGNVDAAKEICKADRSPVASIFYQGLDRVKEGVDVVEKSIVSYGSVQMGLLEKGLVWISLFISLAPMLGFMGTVIGMIGAFDAIEAAGDISPSLVAGGIKVALLTTVFGLIVAIILQIFYNYIVSKIDGLVNNMEDATISFVDILVKYDVVKKQ